MYSESDLCAEMRDTYVNLLSFFQVLPDAGVNPTTGTRAGSTAFYSLDEGKTRFYDIMQMVEFYTLNQGALNTRLSQVRHSPGDPSRGLQESLMLDHCKMPPLPRSTS